MGPITYSASPEMPPFDIRREDAVALERSEAFQVLRAYLANISGNSFCSDHNSTNQSVQEAWLLQRDIIHALIMPIVQLFNRASALAQAALCSTRPDDLELAFRGDGRGAFLFLQCLLSDEEDWCYTRGCPACAVLNTLFTESTLRIAITATLMSSSSSSTDDNSSPASSPTTSSSDSPTNSPNTTTLPSLPFFLPTLQRAVEADPFWGPDYWTHLLTRAQGLQTGIRALMTQCAELHVLVSSPSSSNPSTPISPVRQTRNFTTPVSISVPLVTITEADSDTAEVATDVSPATTSTLRVRKSTFSRRQLRLQREEQEMLERVVRQCWRAVVLSHALDAEQREAARAAVRGRRGMAVGTGGVEEEEFDVSVRMRWEISGGVRWGSCNGKHILGVVGDGGGCLGRDNRNWAGRAG